MGAVTYANTRSGGAAMSTPSTIRVAEIASDQGRGARTTIAAARIAMTIQMNVLMLGLPPRRSTLAREYARGTRAARKPNNPQPGRRALGQTKRRNPRRRGR